MYFKYYTKKTDDQITLLILNKFAEDVLSTLDLEADEITFMQSDNGQLDSNGVKSWLRKRRIFSKFISPYHPNMNGFVERAFRSIKDLSRCMLSAAGLPDPYWEKATSHAVLLRNIMPNQSSQGFVREAYFLWYGLTYDYSRLRVWGSRAYALNHVRGKDFGERSVPGIFVGMKPDNPITYDYEIYLPTKDKFITSGDVMFCEHVDRTEPERLLPPLLTLPSGAEELDVKDFQNLVDTIHLDNDEGVQYRVVKVYKSRGLAVVDRVLYNADNPRAVGGTLDTVFLDNVIGYPIILGKSNPNYQHTELLQDDGHDIAAVTTPQDTEQPVVDNSIVCVLPVALSNPGSCETQSQVTMHSSTSVPHSIKEVVQRAKRLRSEAISAGEIKNTALGSIRRQKQRTVSSNSSHVISKDSEDQVAQIISAWAFDLVPISLWEVQDSFSSYSVDSLSAFNPGTANTVFAYASEPKHHGEAMSRPSERAEWKAAEDREISALRRLNFASIEDIPDGCHLLPSIWVYKNKTDENDELLLRKARLVVRGDLAIEGLEYFETYSPVAKIESIRIVLALIIIHKFIPLQMDIGNAYVQSDLEEPIYLRSIPGIHLEPGKCWKLLKSLYGLKQAGRNWNTLISKFLVDNSFVRLREDLCLYAMFENGILVSVIALYVDDLLLGFNTPARKDWFINLISDRFDTKVLGIPSNLVGLNVKWTPIEGELYYSAVHLVNSKTVAILLKHFDYDNAKPVSLPHNPGVILSKSQCPTATQRECPDVQKMQKEYRVLVGTYLWLQTTTRIDIMSILLVLTQFVANPAYQHMAAALWLLRYLKGTSQLGIRYSLDSDPGLLGYTDADHASHEARRSIYCYLFMLAGGPISWKNGFETRFSLSTAESEIRAVYALREAIKHVIYLKKVFLELVNTEIAHSASIAMTQFPQKIFEDNQSTIRFSENPASQSTMKYLEIDLYWIHDSVVRKEFQLVNIAGSDQLADIGTKLNVAIIFKHLRSCLMHS